MNDATYSFFKVSRWVWRDRIRPCPSLTQSVQPCLVDVDHGGQLELVLVGFIGEEYKLDVEAIGLKRLGQVVFFPLGNSGSAGIPTVSLMGSFTSGVLEAGGVVAQATRPVIMATARIVLSLFS